jgi:YHS domain-containing protein
MGSAIHGKGAGAFDYNGARYTMCCGGCPAPFQADPAKYLKKAADTKLVVGESLYDPTTGIKIDAKKAKGSSDFAGLRYYFASADAKKAFDADPKQFATQPKKESLWCPVMNHAMKSYSDAGAYVDKGDTRYYVCCPDCLAKMKGDMDKFTAQVANKVQAPKAVAAKK